MAFACDRKTGRAKHLCSDNEKKRGGGGMKKVQEAKFREIVRKGAIKSGSRQGWVSTSPDSTFSYGRRITSASYLGHRGTQKVRRVKSSSDTEEERPGGGRLIKGKEKVIAQHRGLKLTHRADGGVGEGRAKIGKKKGEMRGDPRQYVWGHGVSGSKC